MVKFDSSKQSKTRVACSLISLLTLFLSSQALVYSFTSSNSWANESVCSASFSEVENKAAIQGRAYLDGTEQYFTFSHDSEIPPNEVFKLLSSEEQLQYLTPYLKPMSMTELYMQLNATLKRNGRGSVSQKYFETMIVKKSAINGLTPGQLQNKQFVVTILNSLYLGYIFEGKMAFHQNVFILEKKAEQFRNKLSELMRSTLEKKGIPTAVGFDGEMYGQYGPVELKTPTYEDVVATHWLKIEKLRTIFPFASSHVHVGVPQIVTEEKMYAIARIVELRTMLKILIDSKGEISPQAFGENVASSSLSDKTAQRTEGPYVRLNRETFDSPFLAHNLEIKGCFLWQDAKMLSDFVIQASSSQLSLLGQGWPGATNNSRDARLGNVEAALEFLLEILHGKLPLSQSPSEQQGSTLDYTEPQLIALRNPENSAMIQTILEVKKILSNLRKESLDFELSSRHSGAASKKPVKPDGKTYPIILYSSESLKSVVQFLTRTTLWDNLQEADFYFVPEYR